MREQLPDRFVLDGEIFVGAARRRRRRPAGVRGAPGAHPPGQEPDRHAGREDSGRIRRLRPARARRHVVRRAAVRRAPRRAGEGDRRPGRSVLPDPDHHRPAEAEEWFHQFEGAGLDGVVAKPLGAPYVENARSDAEDQARAHRRRRRRGLPRAQDQHARATAAGQPAPRPVRPRRRKGRAAAHRGQRQLHRGPAGRADRAAPAARRPDRGPPVGPLGGVPDRQPRPRARAPRAAGARARTSASPRCGPTW